MIYSPLVAVPLRRRPALFKVPGHVYGHAMENPDGWAVSADGTALEKRFTFANFSQAFAFLTQVAMEAEKRDHHPEFTNVWNRVDFRLTSHDVAGISERDRELGSVIDHLSKAYCARE